MIAKSAETGASFNQKGLNSLMRISSSLRFTFEGGSRGSSVVEAFIGDDYRINISKLRTIAISFDQSVFRIPLPLAVSEVTQNMKCRNGSMLLAHELIPLSAEENSVGKVLAASGRFVNSMAERLNFGAPRQEEVRSINRYIGYATEKMVMLPTDRGSKKILYMSTGAILFPYRRIGLGAKFIEIANALYRPHCIMLRVRSGRAITSLIRTGLVDQDKIYPFFKRYNEDPEKARALALIGERTEHPNLIDPETGLTKAVYLEGRDRAYTPDERAASYKWDKKMWELGLVPDNGDGMYIFVDVIGRSKDYYTDELAKDIEEAA